MAFPEWPCRPLPAWPALPTAVCPVVSAAALSRRQGREGGTAGRREEEEEEGKGGAEPGGRSLGSECGLEQPRVLQGTRAGRGAPLGGRPWGEGRGTVPISGSHLVSAGLAHPGGRLPGTDSTCMQEWRAGLQGGVREPVLGGRGAVTCPGLDLGRSLGLGRVGPAAAAGGGAGGGHGAAGRGVGGPVPREGLAVPRLPAALGNPASCCFSGPGEMDRPSRGISSGQINTSWCVSAQSGWPPRLAGPTLAPGRVAGAAPRGH